MLYIAREIGPFHPEMARFIIGNIKHQNNTKLQIGHLKYLALFWRNQNRYICLFFRPRNGSKPLQVWPAVSEGLVELGAGIEVIETLVVLLFASDHVYRLARANPRVVS